MDNLKFISEVVSSLAWPISVILIVLILKLEISELLKRITHFKHGDSEIRFGISVKEALIEASKEDSIPKEQKNSKEQENLTLLAEQSPRGAILDSWLKIESEIRSYSQRHGFGKEYSKAPANQIRAIEMHSLDSGVLGIGFFQMLNKLYQLRNEAVHLSDKEITPESALEYAELASRVKSRLEEA